MELLRATTRYLFRALAGLQACIALYALAAWLLPMVGMNKGYAFPATGALVYIRSNGVHTDILLPVRTSVKDWAAELPFHQTASGNHGFTYAAFGWGDKGFYLETKEWADLTAHTAIRAAAGLSGSAMHVTYCDVPVESERCRPVRVDERTMEQLIESIAAGFARGMDGRPHWINGHHYGLNDAFYEGTGRYGLFFTCNTWANSVLEQAGLPAAMWTATAGGILRHYP